MNARFVKLILGFFIVLGTSLSVTAKPAKSHDPILGDWQTFDDKTNAKRTIIRMYHNKKNNTYYGQIIKRFKNIPGMTQSDTCVNCPKPFTKKPIKGMVVLWNLKKQPNASRGATVYTGGHAIDPESGKMYRVKARVSKSGKTLVGIGYIDGLSVFSRKQRWIKDK